MTAIVQDVQKQAIASARITLWELDLDGSFAYFHEGLQNFTQVTVDGAVDNSTTVTLAAANTYVSGIGQIVTGTGISGTVTVVGVSSGITNIITMGVKKDEGSTTDPLGPEQNGENGGPNGPYDTPADDKPFDL